MEWYYILFFSVFAFFIFKSVISWMLGDTDIDFDTDGDIDFDVSALFSFKGILHFLLGFSTYLAATARFDRTYDGIGTYQFTWYNYVTAFIIGLAFMYGLWHLYKLMMKFNHYNTEDINLNNYKCTILINNGQIENNLTSYTVLVNTELGSRKINVVSNKENLQIGSEHIITKNVQNIYYIY